MISDVALKAVSFVVLGVLIVTEDVCLFIDDLVKGVSRDNTKHPSAP